MDRYEIELWLQRDDVRSVLIENYVPLDVFDRVNKKREQLLHEKKAIQAKLRGLEAAGRGSTSDRLDVIEGDIAQMREAQSAYDENLREMFNDIKTLLGEKPKRGFGIKRG